MSDQQSTCHDTTDYKLLTRGAYSSAPLYFYERPIATPTGNKWLVTHSLREIGSYLNNRPSPEGVRDYYATVLFLHRAPFLKVF
jgi:hypothetical protein